MRLRYVAVLLLLGIAIVHTVRPTDHTPASDAVETADERVAWRGSYVAGATALPSPTVPGSLAGTEPDGDLSITVSRGTIRVFDYYLTTLGETDLSGVRALVNTEAERQSPSNATEVVALFDRYVHYLEEVRDLRAPTIDRYLADRRALQERYFGDDAEALFGEDNALAAGMVASANQ